MEMKNKKTILLPKWRGRSVSVHIYFDVSTQHTCSEYIVYIIILHMTYVLIHTYCNSTSFLFCTPPPSTPVCLRKLFSPWDDPSGVIVETTHFIRKWLVVISCQILSADLLSVKHFSTIYLHPVFGLRIQFFFHLI